MNSATGTVVWQSFHGDYERIAALIGRSWAENKEQSLEYTADFLSACFAYPGATPELAPTLYSGEPQAFVAGFPRIVRFLGRECRFVLLTFFTVAPELKGKGVGVRLWAEALHRARAAGFDGAFYYCVDGNRSNQATAAGVRAAGFQPLALGTLPYFMRALRRADSVRADVENAPALLQELAAGLPETVPLARQWTRLEAEWQCFRRSGAVCVTEDMDAVLTGYVMKVADKHRTPCLIIEDLLWDKLSQERRVALMIKLLEQGAAKGAQIAIAPQLGYTSMEPLQAAGFRRSPRLLNMYATLWRESPGSFNGQTPIYMDVL